MNSETENLLALQNIDKEINKLSAEMGRYAKMRDGRHTQVERAQSKVDEVRVRIADLEKRVREDERQVMEWRESLRKFAGQQSQVKNQKEYDVLSHEISETEEKISNADEEGLLFLEEEEALEVQTGNLKEKLAERQREFEEEEARIGERTGEKTGLISSLRARRTELESQIGPARLKRYEALSERYPGTCVVPVEDGNCGGCFMRLVLHSIQATGQGKEGALVECNSCHRLLYMPNAEESE